MRFPRVIVPIACAAAPLCAQEITSLKGAVSVRTVDTASWAPPAAGTSLADGAMIATGPNGTIEVRVDASDSFTAGPNSQCKLVALYGGRYELEFTAGDLTLSAGPSTSPMQINLPSVAVQPVQPGIYTVSQAGGKQLQVSVRTGVARVIAPAGSELVNAGQKMLVRDSGNGAEFKAASGVSAWKRFVMVANAVFHVTSDIADVINSGNAAPQETPVSGSSSSDTNAKSVDTRVRTDPPANSAPPPAVAAAGRGK